MAQIDGRFPWCFLRPPSFCVVADWVGGRKLPSTLAEGVRNIGFPAASDKDILAELPEAMATGSMLSRLASKSFRLEHPGPKKAQVLGSCPPLKSIFLHLPSTGAEGDFLRNVYVRDLQESAG